MAPVALPNLRDFSSGHSPVSVPVDAGTALGGASPFSLMLGRCLNGSGIPDFSAAPLESDSAAGTSGGTEGRSFGGHHAEPGFLDTNAGEADPDLSANASILSSISVAQPMPVRFLSTDDVGVPPAHSAQSPAAGGLRLVAVPDSASWPFASVAGSPGVFEADTGVASAEENTPSHNVAITPDADTLASGDVLHFDSASQPEISGDDLAVLPPQTSGAVPEKAGEASARPAVDPQSGMSAEMTAQSVGQGAPAVMPEVNSSSPQAFSAADPVSVLDPSRSLAAISTLAGRSLLTDGKTLSAKISTGPMSQENTQVTALPAQPATIVTQASPVEAPAKSLSTSSAPLAESASGRAARAVTVGAIPSGSLSGGEVSAAEMALSPESQSSSGLFVTGHAVGPIRLNQRSSSPAVASAQNAMPPGAGFPAPATNATGSMTSSVVPETGIAHSGGSGADSSATSGGSQQENSGSKGAGSLASDPKAVLFSAPAPVHTSVASGVTAAPDPSSLHRGLHAWDAIQHDDASRSTSLGSSNEMHLSMHIEELGHVELHATLHGDAVGATISVQKSDAGAALAAGLPHLEHILHEQQIPISHLSLNQSGAGMSQSNSQSHGQSGQQPRRAPWTGMTARATERPVEDPGQGPGNMSRIIPGRLSIRA